MGTDRELPMRVALNWDWPRRDALQYCLKVSLATLLGYLLSFAGSYAVYGAFTAALVVGNSRGEDVGGAANRVRGSLAGMLVGNALPHFGIPPALGVALAIGLTAYFCMGWGWGVSAARIGASLCAVTVLTHASDALDYTLMRLANTLVGIAAGLLVSYVVLPIRGRDAIARGAKRTLHAVADLLDTLSTPGELPSERQYRGVLDSLIEIDKVLRDTRKEFGGEVEIVRGTVHQLALACVGSLSAALAYAELNRHGGYDAAATTLCEQAGLLARRARALGDRAAIPDLPRQGPPGAGEAPAGVPDEVALMGFAQGLRKVEHALAAWPAPGTERSTST